MSRNVIYRSEYNNNKKSYASLCRAYLVKHKIETEDEIRKWKDKKVIEESHCCHQNRLLTKQEPLKLKKKCKHFCEGWYVSDTKCACGQRNVRLVDVTLDYQNFTILDSKYSGKIICN
jgi:hypothetical protein